MGLATALPALADTLATYLPDYVSDLGTVYDRTNGTPTPDSVPHVGGDQTHIIFLAPYSGIYDSDGEEGVWPTQGQGGIATDSHTVQVVCLHGTGANTPMGRLLERSRRYVYAVRVVIRAHNRLGLANDPLWRARAVRYKVGRFEWGGEFWLATQIDVLLAFEEALTPGE